MSMRPTIAPPEVRQRIITMAKANKLPSEIAREIGGGLTAPYVSALLSKARADGEDIPRGMSGPRPGDPSLSEAASRQMRCLEIEVERSTRAYLSAAAERRGVGIPYLVGELLTAIAKDDLINAVLDDGVRS